MSEKARAVPITFPVPFVVESMNLYLFPAEPLTLLDTGPKTEPARQAVKKMLEANGYGVQDLKRIIITHGHIDHFGLARELARASGATIRIHPHDTPKVRPGYNFMEEKLHLLREAGVPEAKLKELDLWSRQAERLLEPLDEVLPLDEREEIPFDSFSLKVIHSPGHSQGHVCLYDKERNELYGGDHILKHITPNPAMEPLPSAPEKRSHSLIQYLGSLEKIDRLAATRIFPAHGPVIDSPHERIQEICRHHLRRKEKIQRLLNGRGSTAYDLAERLFGPPNEMDVFLIVSEVLAHLDLLLREKQAVSRESGGVIYYSLS